MMKQLLALVLCLMLALPCAGAEGADYASLRAEWCAVLDTEEFLCMAEDWALTQTGRYLENGSWAELRVSRLAACSLWMYLNYALALPEPALTEEDYVAWMTAGVDVTFVRNELTALPVMRTSVVNRAASLMDKLQHGVFWRYDHELLTAWVDSVREINRINRQLAATLTNALILNAGDAAAEQTAFAEAYPTIFADYDVWLTDMNAIEQQYSGLVDQMEVQVNAYNALLGVTEANYLTMESLVASGDLDGIRADAVTIDGLPMTLPLPEWGLPSIDVEWIDEAGEMSYAMPGLNLKPCNVAEQLTWQNVDRRAFDEYVAWLVVNGVDFYSQEITADEHTVIYADGEHSFFLTWYKGSAVFYTEGETGVCMAPGWYPGAV
ncbi:MAG: hypothetical protein IKK21_12455 [Clostridia bacterium]|nr:hypothetical protein [Clostridia bacterium]